jgi:hypothetical protein
MWIQVIGFSLRWLGAWLTDSLNPVFYHQLALDRPLDFVLLSQRRLPMAMANAGVVILVYFYARRLFGRRVSLLAVVLMGLDPFYLSDGRTMRGDSLMAGLMALSVLGLLLARRQGSWWQLAFSAVIAGLALLTKMTALPVVIFNVLVLAGLGLLRAEDANSDGGEIYVANLWRRRLRPSLVWLTLVVLTFFLFWPALWTSSGEVWNAIRGHAASSLDGRHNYFLGHHTQTDLLPFFYPITFLFRATPLTLVGLGLLLVAAVKSIARWRHGETVLLAETTDLCLIAAYVSIYAGVMTAGLLKRSWYMLPCFPMAMILAARGWIWLVDWISRRWADVNNQWRQSATSVGVLISILVIQVVQCVPVHPYYYTYWNPLAERRFVPYLEMLNWGIDVSLAAHWLNAHSSSELLKVAVRPSLREIRPIFKGDIVPFEGGEPWVQADYIVVRQGHLQLQEHSVQELKYLQRYSPVYTMTLNGVVYGWIYPGPAAQAVANSQLTGKATLLGYNLSSSLLAVGKAAPLTLYWQNQGLSSQEYIFVQMVDGDSFVWLETRSVPLPNFEEASKTVDAIVESQADLRVPVGTPPGLYFLKMGIKDSETLQLIGEFASSKGYDQVVVTRTIVVSDLPPLSYQVSHRIGDDLLLLGYDLPEVWCSSGEVVDLYWQALQEVEKDYVLALRLLDQSGREAWYRLARPARGIYPTPGWQADEVVRDPWQPPLADDVAPGSYTLELEVYEGDTARSVGKMTLGKVVIDSIDKCRS